MEFAPLSATDIEPIQDLLIFNLNFGLDQVNAAHGQRIRKGDRISYYITGAGANLTSFENCRLADAWDPANPDENTAYYLKRLDEFARKFEPFFAEHHFRLIFSPEDLFGFSPEGIEILLDERAPDDIEDEVPF